MATAAAALTARALAPLAQVVVVAADPTVVTTGATVFHSPPEVTDAIVYVPGPQIPAIAVHDALTPISLVVAVPLPVQSAEAYEVIEALVVVQAVILYDTAEASLTHTPSTKVRVPLTAPAAPLPQVVLSPVVYAIEQTVLLILEFLKINYITS